MEKEFTGRGDAARLAATLLRWSGRSLSSVAAQAGVDKSTLSRFLRGQNRSSIGLQRLNALLAVLGWGPTGPMPALAHHWMLDRLEDVTWIFKDVLSGRTEVAPLFPGSALPELQHVGHLIGRHRGAWLLLEPVPGVPGDDVLEALLDAKNGLASTRSPYVVADEASHRRIISMLARPDEIARLLANDAEPSIELPREARQALSEFLEISTWDEFQKVMRDAVTRSARARADDVALLLEDDLERDYVERNSRSVDIVARLAIRKLAKKMADELAARGYALEWK